MSDEEFDALWTSCDWRQEIDKLRAENAALAEQNEKMSAVLIHIQLMGWVGNMDERITAALTPDISTPAINRWKAEGMEEAAEFVAQQRNDIPATGIEFAAAIRAKTRELRGKS